MDVVAGTGTNQRPDLSDAVADFIADTDYDALPRAVVERVKKSILDVLGVGVYGSPRHEVAAVLAYAKHHAERKESTIFCGGGMASSFQTAMVNGSYVHTTEFAEGFSRALVHPGNSIIPGLLAVCEREHRSGKDLLTGASLGYELNIRMGRTVEAEFNLEQGFHVPAVLGAIASAAACGKALGLDREGIVNVLGISACQMPTALMAATYEQRTVKDLFQGFNSALGVLAADFAVEGITGLHDWVGPWYHAIPRHKRLERLTERLGDYWDVSSGGIRIKTRPVMAMAQPTCFALYDMLQKERFDSDLVEDVLVESSKRIAMNAIYEVDEMVAARASIPFLVAAALVHQEEFASDYYLVKFLRDELFGEQRIKELMSKVRLAVNPEYDFNLEHADASDDPAHYISFEARVTIRLKDGRTLQTYRDVFAAGTGNMNRDDVARKFRACVDGLMPPERAEQVIDMVWRLDDLKDVGELARLMA